MTESKRKQLKKDFKIIQQTISRKRKIEGKPSDEIDIMNDVLKCLAGIHKMTVKECREILFD